MQELAVSIYPELSEPASTRALDGTLECESYSVGGMTLLTPRGVEYHLQLTNTGEGIVLSGTVSCTASAPCSRCLAAVTFEVEGEAQGYYLLEPAESLDEYEADEFECASPEGMIDLTPAITAALVYATPYVVLCREDCAGLCPTCGADLNDGACACSAEDDIDPLNPFAVLKDLDLEDE